MPSFPSATSPSATAARWSSTTSTLDIQPRDFLAFIGPNGGGKTTLIKVILGLLRPWSGRGGLDRPARAHGLRAAVLDLRPQLPAAGLGHGADGPARPARPVPALRPGRPGRGGPDPGAPEADRRRPRPCGRDLGRPAAAGADRPRRGGRARDPVPRRAHGLDRRRIAGGPAGAAGGAEPADPGGGGHPRHHLDVADGAADRLHQPPALLPRRRRSTSTPWKRSTAAPWSWSPTACRTASSTTIIKTCRSSTRCPTSSCATPCWRGWSRASSAA